MARIGRKVLVACPDCDAVQHEPEGAAEFGCTCWRCDAYLGPTHDQRLDRLFALALTTFVVFAVSLLFPLMHINMQGNGGTATLIGASRALWTDGMQPVAAVVFATTVLAPGVDLVALVYLLGGLYFYDLGWRHTPPRFAVQTLRIAQIARSWAMVEVFMLGMLVSLVRLARQAAVSADVALWSLAAFILLFTALTSAVHPRALWTRLAAHGVVP